MHDLRVLYFAPASDNGAHRAVGTPGTITSSPRAIPAVAELQSVSTRKSDATPRGSLAVQSGIGGRVCDRVRGGALSILKGGCGTLLSLTRLTHAKLGEQRG